MMASKTLNGWIFYVHLTVRRVFTLPRIFAPGVGSSLKELIGDRIMEVLPTLQNIFADGLQGHPLQKSQEFKSIEQFVDARRLSGHPITISLEGDPLGDLDQTRGGVGLFPPAASHGCVFMHVPYRNTPHSIRTTTALIHTVTA